MPVAREKFASQADPKILKELKKIANQEGKQFQSVIDEAFRDYVEKKHSGGRPRKHIVKALKRSMSDYDELYKLLAQ